MRIILILLLLTTPIFSRCKADTWGFFAHSKINRLAVFTLPPELIGFYKKNIQYLTEKAVNPDMRRYVNKAEAPRHYIDIEAYGDSALYKMPRYWNKAIEVFSIDSLLANGIVPYHINRVSNWLINAFKNNDPNQVLRLSADLGHYIADANVPLHTSRNYNGQFTDQYGIHGFWESRLPELFFNEYNLLTGKAEYVANLQLYAWDAVKISHEAVDSVFIFEKKLTKRYPKSKKYSFEERGQKVLKTYSYRFSEDYHNMLNGMVERQMSRSIKMVGDFWLSCWIKAGQPDLSQFESEKMIIQDSSIVKDPNIKVRNHPDGHD